MKTVAMVVALASALAACNGSPPPGSAAYQASAAAPKPTLLAVPANQLGHLQLTTAVKTTWSTMVQTTGTVDWDNDHTTQAITQVSGPITRILVDAGAHVKLGDPLLYVASSDTANAISTYRKARNRLDLARRTLDRDRDLLAHKAIAVRDLESAEADYNDAATDVQNALQALRIFGVTARDIEEAERQNVAIQPELAMRAPLSGTIVQRLVLPGQLIQAGTTLAFVITDESRVWVQGHIYEKDLVSVHIGDKVEVRHSSFPQPFEGVISYIGSMIDPATRTTPVRIVTANRGDLLKKDMFVDVTIHDRDIRNVLAIPTEAVLYDEDNFPFVYLQVEQGKFAQRLVKIGGQQDNEVDVVDGLKEGDRIVSQGSVFLQFASTNQQ